MPDLLYDKQEHVAIFTLNRPERRNALTGELFRELDEALADFAADPRMRAGILTGAPPAFCAGLDLRRRAEKDVAATAARRPRARRRTGAGPFLACDKPFVAAINGICVSGGLELALDCDIRICSEEAAFGLFETKRGLYPGYAVHHLARLIPFGEAMYLMLTAETVSPADACRWSLVHEVTAPADLLPRALAIAGAIAANAPLAVQGAKALARHWRLLGADTSYRLDDWVQRAVSASEDAMEGPRAFIEKRPPQWQGR